jgi:patatin-like phospholipase/acyl hydrolase
LRRSDGTLPQLRDALPWPEDRPFRILSIDGGGILGILPAKVLSEYERQFLNGGCIGNYFDLIAGTSTGGIIALALSIGIPASRILKLYLDHGHEVFPPSGWRMFGLREKARFLWELGHYRYSRGPLEARLREIFGTRTLGQADRRLCIPSFDGFTEVYIFKTPHHPDFKSDWREEMVTAALATAAAPTFFPVYRNGDRHFADGGVWANDPAMIGLVDALSCYEVPRRNVHILSLGCGDTEMTMSKGQIQSGGLWHWQTIITAAMHLQSQNALGQAGLLIGRDQLIRVNSPARPGDEIEMDNYERASAELPMLGERLAQESGSIVRKRFLAEEAMPYLSFHGPRAVS